MQHLEPTAQVAMKQRTLEDNLWHLSKVKAENIMRPMYGPTWGYRFRARLSVRWVPKKETVLVGFPRARFGAGCRHHASATSCRRTWAACWCRCAD